MLLLTKRVEKAAAGDHDMTWIKPYTSVRHMQAGDILFRKGDTADRLFIVVSGRCRLRDSNIEITPSTVVGELALLALDKTRTQSLHCEESGDLLEITYGQIKQLYYLRIENSGSISCNLLASACSITSHGSKERSRGCANASPQAATRRLRIGADRSMAGRSAKTGQIRIGIGGWNYPPWRGVFYPAGLTQAKESEDAASRLTSIEINSTFYGSQKPESFRKWASAVPDGFVFSVKGPRFATNRRDLAGAGDLHPAISEFRRARTARSAWA